MLKSGEIVTNCLLLFLEACLLNEVAIDLLIQLKIAYAYLLFK
jgi:hypothetical protein